jgi:hypothetical protein
MGEAKVQRERDEENNEVEEQQIEKGAKWARTINRGRRRKKMP